MATEVWSGRVVDLDGSGVAGARILATGSICSFPLDLRLGGGDDPLTTVSGPDGTFSFSLDSRQEGMAKTIYVIASRDSEVAVPTVLYRSGDHAPEFAPLVLRRGVRGEIHITTSTRRPIEGATIAARTRLASRAAGATELTLVANTNDAGRAVAGPLLDDRDSDLLLVVKHPRFVNFCGPIQGGVRELLRKPIRLREGLVVRGRVLRASGNACPGASITVMTPDNAMDMDFEPRSFAGADGKFEVRGVPTTGAALLIRHEADIGLKPAFIRVIRTKARRLVRLPDIELSARVLAPLRGEVLDPSGQGVVGAYVSATDWDADVEPTAATVSEEDGQFELRLPADGRYTIFAAMRGAELLADVIGRVDDVAPGDDRVRIRVDVRR